MTRPATAAAGKGVATEMSELNEEVGIGLGCLLFFIGVAVLLVAIMYVHNNWLR